MDTARGFSVNGILAITILSGQMIGVLTPHLFMLVVLLEKYLIIGGMIILMIPILKMANRLKLKGIPPMFSLSKHLKLLILVKINLFSRISQQIPRMARLV